MKNKPMSEKGKEVIDRFLGKRTGSLASLSISALMVFVIAYFEYLSGTAVSLVLLYLLPITVTLVFSGFPYAVGIAFFCGLSEMILSINPEEMSSSGVIPYLNLLFTLVPLVLYCVFMFFLVNSYRTTKNHADKDLLTGLYNRRAFFRLFARELKIARRSSKPFTVVFFDLDNFKTVNDAFGHQAGDELLIKVSKTVSAHIRPADLFARMGGDEFVLLLPETEFTGAHSVLKKITVMLTRDLKKRNVSVSMGALTCTRFTLTINQMVNKADDLMYKVKQGGKNGILHEEYPKHE